MISALDSSVILDVLTASTTWADASLRILRRAHLEGRLIVCECVLAEIYPAFVDGQHFEEFLHDWQLGFVPSSQASAMLAGRYFAEYVRRGGRQKRVLPDFLIGAHALLHAERLLARDRGYLRDYFSDLRLIDPVAERI